jgi:hypothetical protein
MKKVVEAEALICLNGYIFFLFFQHREYATFLEMICMNYVVVFMPHLHLHLYSGGNQSSNIVFRKSTLDLWQG